MNNPWKFVLLKLYWFSFHFIFCLWFCLSLYFLVCELPYRQLERRIGALNWRIWVKKQGPNHLKRYCTKKHSKLSETTKREQQTIPGKKKISYSKKLNKNGEAKMICKLQRSTKSNFNDASLMRYCFLHFFVASYTPFLSSGM